MIYDPLSPKLLALRPRQRVIQWLETEIMNHRFRDGAQIPTERELSKMLKVSRNTVSVAIEDIEQRGLLFRERDGARKRFVSNHAAGAIGLPTLTNTSVLIFSDLNPASKEDKTLIPHWSDRCLSVHLLARIAASGRPVTLVNNEMLGNSDVESLFVNTPAGVIVTSSVRNDPNALKILNLCKRRKIPIAAYGNGPDLQEFDRIYTDHCAGAKLLTQWLIKQGCKKILPLFPNMPILEWERKRVQGYHEAMFEANLEPMNLHPYKYVDVDMLKPEEEFIIYRSFVFQEIEQLVRRKQIDAIMCLTDHQARIAISALRILGVRPNKDILVTGYDNIEDDPFYESMESENAIATIDKLNSHTSEVLGEVFLKRLEGKLPPEPQACNLIPELVIRQPKS